MILMSVCWVDHQKVYYERIGNAASNHKLLFVHGAAGNAEIWRSVRSLLPSFDSIVADLPGHYRSEGKSKKSIEEYADFLREFIRTLGFGDGSSLILIGHSMGGAIGLEIACRGETWIQRLILVNSAPRLKVHPRFLSDLSEGVFNPSLFETAFGPNASVELKQNVLKQSHSNSVHTSYDDFSACDRFDRREALSGVRIPVLIIAGTDDRLTPAAHTQMMKQHISDSCYVEIEQCGHFAPLEQPERVADAIHTFLSEPKPEV